MKKWNWKALAGTLVLNILLALEISLVLDAAVVFCGSRMTPPVYVGSLAVILAGILLCRKFTLRGKICFAGGLLAAVALIAGAMFLFWQVFQSSAGYEYQDRGKQKLYADHNVMVIVPHQDDEINILGGVLEEFTEYGSTVRIVYTTSGDYLGRPETRIREAVAYAASAGIPEENLIFLGYGDQWDDQGPDIYNSAPDEVRTSHSGKTATYNLGEFAVYREGAAYTLNNFCADIKSVILEFAPDVIFAIDYDKHVSHMSTSLVFDRVMGEILKEEPGYQPLVFKSYAYATAWYADSDFFCTNILSTRDPFEEPGNQKPMVYSWEDRIRLPVQGKLLSRSLVDSGMYDGLACFDSERAQDMARGVVNGDRVAWQRRTDSLCSTARIQVSSGVGELLNNFMLIDNVDILEKEDPYDGVWIPEEGDGEKTAEIQFAAPADVHSIVLYDHPDPMCNVLDAVITFSNGEQLHTGPLIPGGSATRIPVEKKAVSGFSIRLEAWEGTGVGLSEVEAFEAAEQNPFSFVKLMDEEGNFAYDYCLEGSDTARFQLYTYGAVPRADSGAYHVQTSGEGITAELADGTLTVTSSAGGSGVVSVECREACVSDSITVRNPGQWKLFQIRLGQRIEEAGRFRFRQTMAFRLVNRVAMLFGERL